MQCTACCIPICKPNWGCGRCKKAVYCTKKCGQLWGNQHRCGKRFRLENLRNPTKRKAPQDDKYQGEVKRFQFDKLACNMSFAQKVLACDFDHSENLLYLDGELLTTSQLLNWMGYNKEQLIVPNNSQVATSMADKDICTVHSMSLSDYIMVAAVEKKKFIGVWADYCGLFKTYREDISNLFKLGMLKDRAIFCATFCTRGDEPREKIKKQIEKFAEENGHVAVELEAKIYTNMFFIAFSIHKTKIFT